MLCVPSVSIYASAAIADNAIPPAIPRAAMHVNILLISMLLILAKVLRGGNVSYSDIFRKVSKGNHFAMEPKMTRCPAAGSW